MTVLSLAEYEGAVGGVLAVSLEELDWPAEVVDAGLRMALGEYERAAPAVEVEFEVTAAGMKQDLSAIADLRKVGAVAWPWVSAEATSFTGRPRWVRFMTFDGATVRLVDCVPQVGDCLLVSYWRKYEIAGLGYVSVVEGGIEGPPLGDSNVPEVDQGLLIGGAAGHACSVRLRRLSETAGVPEGTAAELGGVRDGLLAEFHDGLAALGQGGRSGGVVWGNIGL